MADDRIDILVKVRGAREYGRDMRRAADDTRRLGDETHRTGKEFDGAAAAGKVFRNVVGLVKPAALITGLGLTAQAAAGAAAGVVALTAALAPAAGAVAAFPVAALAAGQGLGVFKLATVGLKDAIGGLNGQLDAKKLAALTPEARGFAQVIQGIKPQIVDLQRSLQSGLFAGVTRGLKSALPALGVLKPQLAATSRIVGNFAENLGKLVGSRGFLRDLRSQASFNNRLLGLFGQSALHLANAFRNVLVTARPLTMWLARTVKGWTAAIDRTTRLGREQGTLARFFEKTRSVLSHLFSIAGSLAVAFKNVGVAAFPLGSSLLTSLDKGAKALARWTGSAKGMAAIRKFFADAKPVIESVARLFGQITASFGKLATGKGVAPVIDQLTALVPVISDVVASTTQAFGPHLIALISTFAKVFAPFAGTSGPLVLFVDGLTALSGALLWFENHVPGATTVLTALVGAFAALKAIGLASMASQLFGFKRGLEAVKGAMTFVKDACILTRIQLALLKVQQLATAAATRVAAAATWLFNAAMRANPIGLVITGLTLLAAGFVLAYKKIGWFRNGVNAVWGWIKSHWPLLLSILTGPIGAAVIYIIRHFDKVVGFIKRIPGRIGRAAKGMFDGIKNAFRDALNWIIRKWNGFELHWGGVKIKGHTVVPGFTIGTPDIPLLAKGGTVMGAGQRFISGEAGPELGTVMGNGKVRIQPLDTRGLGARMLGGLAAAAAGPGGQDLTVNFNVDGRTLTRAVLRGIHNEDARK